MPEQAPPGVEQLVARAAVVGELFVMMQTGSRLAGRVLERQHAAAVDLLVEAMNTHADAPIRWREVEEQHIARAWEDLHHHMDELAALDAGDVR